jgi:cysteine desulfurase
MMPRYLDANATGPVEPEVLELVIHYMRDEYGNSGSRTHPYGVAAKKAVELARAQVASVVDCGKDEVIFTSGATESDNLAILGLRDFGMSSGRRHLITGATEHKAVLEPMEYLASEGFEVTVLPADSGGYIRPEDLQGALRQDTLLVSLMHVNNETGVAQPLNDYSDILASHECYFHCDAAQGFGKEISPLTNRRIDLISVSGHKIYAPKGLGALIARRRRYKMPPLKPLMYGGGQERGLRPGTLPVPLIAGLGKASELALKNNKARNAQITELRAQALGALLPLGALIHGDRERMLPHVLNLSVPGVNSEAALIALKDIAAISNGSACTSASYKASHVLEAMGLNKDQISGALRISWSHMTESPDWADFTRALASLK